VHPSWSAGRCEGNRKNSCWVNKSRKRIETGHFAARDGPGGNDGMRSTALNHLASLLCSGPALTANVRSMYNLVSFRFSAAVTLLSTPMNLSMTAAGC
jgi:hypothetical protein